MCDLARANENKHIGGVDGSHEKTGSDYEDTGTSGRGIVPSRIIARPLLKTLDGRVGQTETENILLCMAPIPCNMSHIASSHEDGSSDRIRRTNGLPHARDERAAKPIITPLLMMGTESICTRLIVSSGEPTVFRNGVLCRVVAERYSLMHGGTRHDIAAAHSIH